MKIKYLIFYNIGATIDGLRGYCLSYFYQETNEGESLYQMLTRIGILDRTLYVVNPECKVVFNQIQPVGVFGNLVEMVTTVEA